MKYAPKNRVFQDVLEQNSENCVQESTCDDSKSHHRTCAYYSKPRNLCFDEWKAEHPNSPEEEFEAHWKGLKKSAKNVSVRYNTPDPVGNHSLEAMPHSVHTAAPTTVPSSHGYTVD
jgi:hypothetical protein